LSAKTRPKGRACTAARQGPQTGLPLRPAPLAVPLPRRADQKVALSNYLIYESERNAPCAIRTQRGRWCDSASPFHDKNGFFGISTFGVEKSGTDTLLAEIRFSIIFG
jgi:hypothetical protein